MIFCELVSEHPAARLVSLQTVPKAARALTSVPDGSQHRGTEEEGASEKRERPSVWPVLALAGVVGTVSACTRVGVGVERRQPVTRPAAIQGADLREEPAGIPFALATDEDFVVRVVAGSSSTCSGALIEDDQVLTARHCIVERGSKGELLPRNADPASVVVEIGGDHFPWGEVGVRAIVSPTCGHAAGDGDVAILVLERKLVGVPTHKARLEEAPAVGDQIQPIGFGRCVFTSNVIRRASRVAGPINEIAARRFRLDANICPGDSGGPALDPASGRVVGVISSAVMDADEKTTGRAEFTRLDAFREVFSQAALVASGMSLNELPPIECR